MKHKCGENLDTAKKVKAAADMSETNKQIRRNLWILAAATVAILLSPLLVIAQEQPTTGGAPLQMVSARIWLNKGLDAKKAKQGDPVTAKLLDDTKMPNSHDLPKNTILLGHVDTVQPSVNKGDSSIQVTFDHAQLKDGQQLPIKVTIMRISPAPAFAVPGGGSLPPDRLSPSSTSGVAAARNPGSAAPPPGSPTAQAAQTDQGVDGVSLKSDIHESASGTFTSKGRNMYLNSGTEMQIAILVIPSGSAAQ